MQKPCQKQNKEPRERLVDKIRMNVSTHTGKNHPEIMDGR